MFSPKGKLGIQGLIVRECVPSGLGGQWSGCPLLFYLFIFVKECLVGPNILVHYGTTRVLNVLVSSFKQCGENECDFRGTMEMMCPSKDRAHGEAHLDQRLFLIWKDMLLNPTRLLG